MSIKVIQLGSTGLVDVQPRVDYLFTDDDSPSLDSMTDTNTLPEVLQPRYLNASVDAGFSFDDGDLVAINTKEGRNKRTGLYQVQNDGGDYSLIPLTSSPILGYGVFLFDAVSAGGPGYGYTVAGLLDTDLVFGTVAQSPTNPAGISVIAAFVLSETLYMVLSDTPVENINISYMVLRP